MRRVRATRVGSVWFLDRADVAAIGTDGSSSGRGFAGALVVFFALHALFTLVKSALYLVPAVRAESGFHAGPMELPGRQPDPRRPGPAGRHLRAALTAEVVCEHWDGASGSARSRCAAFVCRLYSEA